MIVDVVRCCFHRGPDPRCMQTKNCAHPSPLPGILPNVQHPDQSNWWFCCRCGRRMTMTPWNTLTRVVSAMVPCKAKPEASAADTLIASTTKPESPAPTAPLGYEPIDPGIQRRPWGSRDRQA